MPPPGLDKCTQIPRYDWDLHDFNIEVEPVLQVLVGRNLEQARIELIEEEEEREFRRQRKAFEVRRNIELLKTQRMDEEHRRMQEEVARRELQRALHYENKKQAHKKLYSRVLAKSLLEGIEAQALQTLGDLSRPVSPDYFKDAVEEAVPTTFYDWLVANTTENCLKHRRVEQALGRVANVVPADWRELHEHALGLEQRRLQKIEDDRLESQKRFDEERRARRERRQQLRVQRSKRKLKEEIESKVISRKTNELDILALKAVSYLDQDSEPKKFRTYGGFLFELWSVLTTCKKALAERTEVPPDKFLLDDDLKKLLLTLLSDPNLKDKAIRINLHPKHRQAVEEHLELMDRDLFAFNDQKEEFVSALAELPDLLLGEAFDPALSEGTLDPEILKALLRTIFRFYFKSNDYKVLEEPVPPPADPKDPGLDPDPAAKPDGQDGDLSNRHPPSASHHDPGEPLGTHESHPATHRKAPEVTEEDRKVEQLKKKFDLQFPEPAPEPHFCAVLRIRETLNRDELRPEVKAQREEEAELLRQQAEAVEDPKKTLAYHRKQYLLDEYLKQLREEEERKQRLAEEEEARRQEEYIEVYDGRAYERDLALHDIEEADRPATNVNEALALGGGREVLYVHRVNQRLLRRAFFDKMKDCLKEMTLIKDVKLRAEQKALDDRLEQLCLQQVVRSHDETPIFDIEI